MCKSGIAVQHVFVHRTKGTVFKEVMGQISNITINETQNKMNIHAQIIRP